MQHFRKIAIVIIVASFILTCTYILSTDIQFYTPHLSLYLNPLRRYSELNDTERFSGWPQWSFSGSIDAEEKTEDECGKDEIQNTKLRECVATGSLALNLTNPPWQELRMRNGNIAAYLYGAYLDTRDGNMTRVHVLTMWNRMLDVNLNLVQCHFWYDGSSPNEKFQLISPAKLVKMSIVFSVKAGYLPSLAMCETPKHFSAQVPSAVALSLVELNATLVDEKKKESFVLTEICRLSTTNFLPVVYNRLCGDEVQADFGICHKALYFVNVDPSELLIEWLEIHRILGVSKIFMYEYLSHPNVTKVLKYYKGQGLVETKHHPIPVLPQDTPPDSIFKYLMKHRMDKWVNELIPYHDCFFRNMYKFKFLALIDMDEVIMPIQQNSWRSLIDQLENGAYTKDKKPIGGFSFQNHIFPDNGAPPMTPDAPKYHYMLQHLTRMESGKTKQNTKLIYSTAVGLGVYNHHPKFCLFGKCRLLKVDPGLGRLHHYCVDGAKTCDRSDFVPFTDLNMWRFKDQLIQGTETACQKIDL